MNKLKAHTSATNVKNFEIPYRSQSTSSYSVAGFFLGLPRWYMKTVAVFVCIAYNGIYSFSAI